MNQIGPCTQRFQLKVLIPGKPVPKARPRLGRGRTYTPKPTVDYESTVGMYANVAMRDAGLKCTTQPLRVVMNLAMPIPKWWAKATRANAVAGHIYPTTGADSDNLAKSVLDGLQKIVFDNDAQVVELHVFKAYGLNPGAAVLIEALQETVGMVA